MAWAVGNTDANFAAGSSTTIAGSGYTSALNAMIFVTIRQDNIARFVTGIADTLGNTYYKFGVAPAAAGLLEVWICNASIGSGSNTVTATFNTSCANRGIAIAEFTGGDHRWPGLPWQWTSTGAPSSTTVTSQAHNSLTAAGLEVWGIDVNATGTTWTAGTGFTIAVQDASHVTCIQYRVYSGQQLNFTTTISSSSGAQKHYVLGVFTEDQGSTDSSGPRGIPFIGAMT